MTYIYSIFHYILENKDWIFSGIGVLVLSGFFIFIQRLRTPRKRHGEPPGEGQSKELRALTDSKTEGSRYIPPAWQGILPEQSKYGFRSEARDSIFLGQQTFTFEYGPHGHAKSLMLIRSVVQLEIRFTCKIVDVYKAAYAAGEYALNILQPKFLVLSRDVLERFSLSRLRTSREKAAQEIIEKLSGEFKELGARLESVVIGAIEKIGNV